MAIADSKKLDFLWKKIIYGVSETDIDGKGGPNETIASPVATYAKDIWAQADQIPAPADEFSGVVELVTLQCTADSTVGGNVTWIATTTSGDANTQVGDFVPPTFDPAYLAFVYNGDPDAGGTSLNAGITNTEWVFDYVAGTLHFPNNLPGGTTEVWIRAYRYIGEKGLTGGAVGRTSMVNYPDIASRDADANVLGGQFALVDDAGDGEYAFYTANTAGPTSSWTLLSTQDSTGADAKSKSSIVLFDGPGTTILTNASKGKTVISVTIEVTEAFDAGATITVGDGATTDLLAGIDDSDLSDVATFIAHSNYEFVNTIDTEIRVYLNAAGASAGAAKVTVAFL